MDNIPPLLRSLMAPFGICFSRPTFRRFQLLALAAVIAVGSRTIAGLVRALRTSARSHPSTFHRFFSMRRWSTWRLARCLARLVIDQFASAGTIRLAGDDSTLTHRGKRVYGAGCHRDAVRSTSGCRVFCFGHKWVVLFILVEVPMTRRLWALPLLVGLYRSRKWDETHHERHRSPPEIMRGLLITLLRWFPQRRFVFVGDAAYMTHRLAALAARSQRRLVVVGPFRGDAAIYAPPPVRASHRRGRPAVKGKRLACPSAVTKSSARSRVRVRWYGCKRHGIEVVDGIGLWHEQAHGNRATVRWVFVHDPSAGYKDVYLAATDPTMTPKAIVEAYVGRWAVETTFQEAKTHLGLGSARNRKKASVIRQTACLFGLYSLVALLYARLHKRERYLQLTWPGKTDVSFADALASVRRKLWCDWFFRGGGGGPHLVKLPARTERILLNALAGVSLAA